MVEADYLEARVCHAFVLGLIPGLALLEVMGRPIYIDHGLVLVIHEVRPGHASLEEDLSPGRKAEVLGIEVAKPVLFELGITEIDQALEVILPALGTGRHLKSAQTHGEEVVLDQVAVQELVVPLVPVGHQAVIAGRFAGFHGPLGEFQVLASDGVEVQEVQGHFGHLDQGGLAILHQSPEYSSSTFGALVDEDLGSGIGCG